MSALDYLIGSFQGAGELLTADTITGAREELVALRAQKDAAYVERDRLVCALSKLFPSWIGRHDNRDTTWDDEWRWIVFVQLPTGQASWHVHDSEIGWFAHCATKGDAWDGHTTPEKYERLAALRAKEPHHAD